MELAYLLASLAGIVLIVALCAVLFPDARAKFADAQAVESFLVAVLPAYRTEHIALSQDGRTALAVNGVDGTLHLVVRHGDGAVERKLTADLLKRTTLQGGTLVLALADFTLPRARLTFSGDALAEEWRARLDGVL